MSRQVKIILRIIGIALGILIILWLGLAAYITYNKKAFLKAVSTQLNNNINGKLTIGSMDAALLHGFPGISVKLHNVLLKDSLFEQHGHNLLKAE